MNIKVAPFTVSEKSSNTHTVVVVCDIVPSVLSSYTGKKSWLILYGCLFLHFFLELP